MLNNTKSRLSGINLLIAIIAAFVTVQLSAQDISLTPQGNHDLNRFYADLVGKTATLNGGWGLFGGMRAGYNINNNISIGLIGHGLIPDKLGGSYINQEGEDELHFGYGGAEVIYKYNLSDKFYLAGMMMAGAGRTDYEELGGHDYFFIMEPGASINYRIADWFGLGLSAGYRFAAGVNYADLSDASFSGWSSSIDFKFGF
ncbi:MAG: hypothetical protein HXY48_06005 [Ignavibacteriaceae bacterium]|nr:hypothetical protein [Ignavibacteriaceae bacterium]